MAIVNPTAVSVDDSAAVLLASDNNASVNGPSVVYVQTETGDDPIYVGGPDVTAANGIALTAATLYRFDLGPGDNLYAICDTAGTATARVMQQGQ